MIHVKPQLSKKTCQVCLQNTSTKCCFFYSHSNKDNINANILNHLKTHPDKICYNCIEKIITDNKFKCPFCREEISTDHIVIDIEQKQENSKCNFETKNNLFFGIVIMLVTILWFFLGLIACWLTNDDPDGGFNPNCIMIGLTAAFIPTLFYYNRKNKFHWCKNCGFSIYVALVFGFAIAIRSANQFEGVYLFYSFIIFFVTFFSLLLCTQL